jgi:hypothetical protein
VALPSNVGVVVVHGFWLDETTGHGVRRSDGHPATVTFEPVSLTGDPDTPNVRDSGAHTHIKTRTRVARVDPDTGYYAAILVASDDPDIDPYGGRRVTFSEEDPFVVEVPYNAPPATVDALMAAATGLAQGSTVAALPLVQAALLELPAPAPPIAYLTSTQVLSTVVTAIEAHDDDPQAHPALRALINSSGGGGGGGPTSYHHEQVTPLSTWTISHALGYRPAGVVARDATGLIEPANITYPDANTCVLAWAVPVSGSVDLS